MRTLAVPSTWVRRLIMRFVLYSDLVAMLVGLIVDLFLFLNYSILLGWLVQATEDPAAISASRAFGVYRFSLNIVMWAVFVLFIGIALYEFFSDAALRGLLRVEERATLVELHRRPPGFVNLKELMDRAEGLILSHPENSILTSVAGVDLALREAFFPEERFVPWARLLQAARPYLNPSTSRELRDVRLLRNRIAHPDLGAPEVIGEDAGRVWHLVRRVIDEIHSGRSRLGYAVARRPGSTKDLR